MTYHRFIALRLPIGSLPALGLNGSRDADAIIFGKLRCLLADQPKAGQPWEIHPAVINRPESHDGPNRGTAVGRISYMPITFPRMHTSLQPSSL